MRTEIHLNRTSSGWIKSTPDTAWLSHYVVWKPLTYGLWLNTQGRTTEIQQSYYTCEVDHEINIWKQAVIETSLGSFEDILNFKPAIIPKHLYNEYISSANISAQEKFILRKQAYLLWLNDSSTLSNPHPMLIRVSQALGLKEALGTILIDNINDMLLRDYHLMRLVLDYYYEVQKTRFSASSLQREAGQKQPGQTAPKFTLPYDLQ